MSWFTFHNLKLVLGMGLTFYSCVEKRLKDVKSVEANYQGTFLHFPPPPILNRVESELKHSPPVKTIKKEKDSFHCFIDCSKGLICFITAIILENMFGNIKSALFTCGGTGVEELYWWVCRCSISASLTYLFIYLFNYLSICLFIYLFIYLLDLKLEQS